MFSRSRIAGIDKDGASDRYWVLATALEAHLVRGDLDAARGLVEQVVVASGRDYAGLATTGRQLERIVRAKKLDSSVLFAFEPPTVVHFLGPCDRAAWPEWRVSGGAGGDRGRRYRGPAEEDAHRRGLWLACPRRGDIVR